MILIGTSGFKYKDWVGEFYPAGIKDGDMLAFYAQHFPVVELDFSYYVMPARRTTASLAARTPKGFLFCIKAHKSMTHEVGTGAVGEAFGLFLEGIAPIIDAGKLGCVLLQFPWGFKNTPENVDYIKRLPELLLGLPSVVEFRNREWLSDRVFGILRECGLGFCAVDEPGLKGLMPPVVVATSGLGYVRFHGRNSEKWWKHEAPWERYNYLYTEEELREWVPRVRGLANAVDVVFVLFNNCHAGHAVRNSLMMARLLEV